MANVVILGKGPAGISAALYTTRAGLRTTVIGKDFGALGKAHAIENYYGFGLPVSGEALATSGVEQARRLGAEIIEDEVTGIGYRGRLVVQTTQDEYMADYVILATGAPRVAPRIPGLSEFEGRGVSYCAVCDAFFHREKNVAVLGAGEYALHEVWELLPVVGSVTLLTNGELPDGDVPDDVILDTRKVTSIEEDPEGLRVHMQDGASRVFSGVFVALGVAGSADIARKIGAAIQGNRIIVDDNMATTVPGLYAAGDCTGGMLQVAKAVYEGAKAGTAVAAAARAAAAAEREREKAEKAEREAQKNK